MAVQAENRQDTMPGMRPMLANAEGKASAPLPIIVLARFEKELNTLAPGGSLAAARAMRCSRRRERGDGRDIGGWVDVAPYDDGMEGCEMGGGWEAWFSGRGAGPDLSGGLAEAV
jgi:hypothetical protein